LKRPFIYSTLFFAGQLSSLFFCFCLVAQQPFFKVYNINDGLPSTSVYGAYQDKYGYLWICSPSGLSRFDGRQFVNYSLAEGLPALNTVRVFQDSKDRLWTGTTAGMAQFVDNRFISFSSSDGQTNMYVFDFAETSNATLLALTSKGAYKFTDSSWQKISLYPGFDDLPCRGFKELNGEWYVNYPYNIACRDSSGKWSLLASMTDHESMYNNIAAEHGEIWVTTNHNILKIRDHVLSLLYPGHLPVSDYFSFMLDSRNALWLCGYDLLRKAQDSDRNHFVDYNKYRHNTYSKIIEDSSKNIWIGSSDGLIRIRDIETGVIDQKNNKLLDGIYNIIPLVNGGLLMSSGSDKGLLLYKGNRIKRLHPKPGIINKDFYRDPVDGYTFDDNKLLWMITRFKKLLCYNGKDVRDVTKLMQLTTTEHLYDMNFSSKRKKIFVCADSTLLVGSADGFSKFIPANTKSPIVKPTRVHECRNGLILLYLDERGVFCIDRNNNLISLINETAIDGSKKGIQLGVCFYEDPEGDFWIAMPGFGLYDYQFTANGRLYLKKHFTTSDGMQSNNLLGIIMDREKKLWLSSNAGVDILQRNQYGNWEVFNYATAADLAIDKSDYVKLAADNQGNIFLSSPNKVFTFNSAIVHPFRQTPRVIIEKVTLGFMETNWKSIADSTCTYYQLPYKPVLNHTQNSIGIQFNAISLSGSGPRPEYAYKLLPLDTSWSNSSKINSVSLTQLRPGRYIFMVKAKDKASDWSIPASFEFTIKAPFWDGWLFRIAIIVLAAALVIFIFRKRIEKIRHDAGIENQLRELEMKALKAQMNPHFIYNALNSIQSLIANNKKEESIHYIGSFSRLLRYVLDNADYPVINLSKEIETIVLYIQLERLRLDVSLKFTCEIAQDIVPEFEKLPPLVIQPFIENALWHGLGQKQGDKKISISVMVEDQWLICHIEDNGIGRKKANEINRSTVRLHQSKGIDITRKRLFDYNSDSTVMPVEFTDLYDTTGAPGGTLVILRIKRKGLVET